jgi:nuclear transport factor 2 (NTF2) superfamily protein
MSEQEPRPQLPPFTHESAVLKVRKAEDAWNRRDPASVALAYTADSRWRNRSEFFTGRPAIIEFLTRKWAREHEYRLIKELWAFTSARIAVRFAYEFHDESGAWFRAYGNENWLFASINDVAIAPEDRKFFWDRSAPRPAEHPGLSELGL